MAKLKVKIKSGRKRGDVNKRWTEEEDEIVFKAVVRNPTNFVEAFRQAEDELPGRTIQGIGARWFSVISKSGHNAMVTASASGIIIANRKTTFHKKDSTAEMQKDTLKEIVSKLKKEQRAQIIDFILNL